MMELEGGDEDWMRVRKVEGEIGLVPRNYVRASAEMVEGNMPMESEEASNKYIAIYDYTPEPEQAATCLTITAGQILYVGEEANGWFMASTETGERGFVPITYVQKA